jgi:hypothetical protein
MSTKLKGSLYIDDDIKLIYKDSMYKIFIDDHYTKYEMYDSGNAVTGYIRLFILNKETNHIRIINDIFIEIDRSNSFLHIDLDNIRNELYLIQLLESEEIKKSIYSYIDNISGY